MKITNVLCVSALVVISGGIGYFMGSSREPSTDLNGSLKPTSDSQYHEKETSVSSESIQRQGPSTAAETKLSLEQITKLDDWSEKLSQTMSYFEGLNKDTLEAYLREIENLTPSMSKNHIMSMFLMKWGEFDGQAAYEYALNTTGKNRSQLVSQAVAGWSKTDPDQAWEIIMDASSEGKSYKFSFYGVLSTIAQDDLEKAFQLAMELKPMSNHSFNGIQNLNRAIPVLIQTVAQSGKYQELNQLLTSYPDLSQSKGGIEALYQNWGEFQSEEPLAAIKLLQDSELAHSAMSGFMKGWAQTDGYGAFQYAIENQSDEAIAAALPQIARSVVETATPDELTDIIAQFDRIENRDEVATSLIHTIGISQPQIAMDLAMSMESEQSRLNSIRSATHSWASHDIDAADAYTQSIEDKSLRLAASRTIISQRVTRGDDPNRVLSYLDNFEDQKTRRQVLSSIVYSATYPQNRKKSQELIQIIQETELAQLGEDDKFRQSMMKRINAD